MEHRFIPARAGNTTSSPASPAATAVHPRSRGEHPNGRLSLEGSAGSSPLARGTPRPSSPTPRTRRFIPARAGNTTGSAGGPCRAAVHPRSRGEHGAPDAGTHEVPGSSPLARGTPGPGGVGRRPVAVHPRSRGEHEPAPAGLRGSGGSSPLARGTHPRGPQPIRSSRFIPARAGNTIGRVTRHGGPAVHPRSRGEHDGALPDRCEAIGSSPLARGTPLGGVTPNGDLRFIPARAGNTRPHWHSLARTAVHPRSRGEHRIVAGTHAPATGSSPLARGTRPTTRVERKQRRFIPARAGNTTYSIVLASWAAGSSPLARGTRRRPSPPPSVARFIPARAGNTQLVTGTPGRSHGSSPLARGTRLLWCGITPARRFIPARAGNTLVPAPRGAGERGSSPLARGTPARAVVPPRRLRFIPARAGNTPGPGRAPPRVAVHPRSRGEHTSPCAAPPPPRRWSRFIPARAGNTRAGRRRCARPAVHPRSRGEHPSGHDADVCVHGSSPLARGTPPGQVVAEHVDRFIPARAGNTRQPAAHTRICAVHPRSRGEHEAGRGAGCTLAGSSPLARGTRPPTGAASTYPRFIPARAGNTSRSIWASGSPTVHPRSRGEHAPLPPGTLTPTGSSPLARGTLPGPKIAVGTDRFIPARAGNTRTTRPPRGPRSVHPRSRGEHEREREGAGVRTGSSPLARGTRVGTHRRGEGRRFIPARAGNTRAPRGRRRHSRRFIPARAGNTSSGQMFSLSHPVHPRSRGEHRCTG